MCGSDDAIPLERESSKFELGLGGVKFGYLETSGGGRYFSSFPFCLFF